MPIADGALVYREGFRAGIAPIPDMTISEYADEFRILEGGSAAEPGKYRTSRTPYLKEIMDALSPSSSVREVKVIKGTQLGFTEVGNNIICHAIEINPCPVIMVFPKEGMAMTHSRDRLGPCLEKMPLRY